MLSQISVSIIVNLLSLIYGISVGWASPIVILYQSDFSPVGRLGSKEISLITSLLSLGGIIGNVLFGSFIGKFGRKKILMFLALPTLIAYFLISIGDSHYYIYVSRILVGLSGGGLFVLIPIFVTEISNSRNRGALGSILMMMTNSGMLLGFIIASLMDYYISCYLIISFVLVFLVLFVWYPDSPESYLMENDYKSAQKSLVFYHGSSNKDVQNFDNWKRGVNAEKMGGKVTVMEVLRGLATKGFVYGLIILAFRDLCGITAILTYSSYLFKEANTEVPYHLSTIIMGSVQIVGSVLSIIFVDRFGRRLLLIVSALGTGISLLILGAYFAITTSQTAPAYLQMTPLICLSVFVFMATIGIVTLPYVIIVELTPPKLRSATTTITLFCSWSLSFILVYCFLDIYSACGLSGTFFLFGLICLTEIPIVYFLVPETKNLTFEEIQLKLELKGITSNK